MDHAVYRRFLSRPALACAVGTVALMTSQALPAQSLVEGSSLNNTASDLDNLLAAEEARPREKGQEQLPALDKLISPDIMPREVLEGDGGTINVYNGAAKSQPKLAQNTEESRALETKPEPVTGASALPAPISGANDPIITDVAPSAPSTTVELPPALNTLPNLPPLQGGELEDPPTDLISADHGPSNAPDGAQTSISTNFSVNLVAKLVERGVLTPSDAQELIQMAQLEANLAKEKMATEAQPDDGSVRVTYIPEVVKKQIRDEVRSDVMAQAKSERWAAPDVMPDWVGNLKPFGDVRLRYEYSRYPEGNDNTGAFPNFNAINTGSPFDVSGLVFSPQNNVDQDRQRFRLRARIGAEFQLGDGFTAGLRLATGESNSPVSPNQTLGASGGNFSKYAIWVDRAFIKYELGAEHDRSLALSFGRFDNPFFNTDIVWDDDLGFDGIALQARYKVTDWLTPFVTGGFFPVYNTDLNYSSNQPVKFESEDKWLYGAQAGFDLKIKDDIKLKFAAGYYDFYNIEGRLSDPFIPLTASDAGNTDATRPSFAQKGNTYRPIRNIIASPLNDFGTSSQYQYFGLATPFRELTLTGRLEINTWEPYQIAVIGEFVKNLEFDQEAINAVAVNNRGASDFLTGSVGEFAGGDTGWFAGVQFGKGDFDKRGDWNATFGYRYVESDAVVDAFTDSDFGGGGTNLQGYVIGTSVALSPDVRLGLRWMSADEIAGPPLKNDIIQVDITAKF